MITNIHALRAFAALIVSVYHVQPMVNENFGGRFKTTFGAAGVDVFFVISGFVMVYSNSTRKTTPLMFLWDRAARVYPLWWVALGFLLVLFGVGFRPAGLHSFTWDDVTASFLLVAHVRSVGTLDPILTLGWTLLYEIYFYLLFACCLWFRRLGQGVLGLSVFLGLGIVFGNSLASADSSPVLRFYTSPIMLEFLAGCVLGLAYSKAHHGQDSKLPCGREHDLFIHRKLLRVSGWFLFALGAIMILGYDVYNGAEVGSADDRPYGRLAVFGAPAVMIVSGALILEYSGALLRWATVGLLGSASYALYLFHVIVLQAVVKAWSFITSGSMSLIGQLCVATFAVCCAVAFSVFMHVRIEVPLAQLLKRTRAVIARRL